MKKWARLLTACAAVALGASAGRAQSPAPSPSASPEAAGTPAPPPAALHALDGLAGKWLVEVTQMSAGRPALKLRGTSDNAWILGRRFLQCTVAAGEGEMAVQGVTTFGYDPRTSEFFAVGVSTSNSPYLTLHGPYYEQETSFVLRGDDPAPSLAGRIKRRYVIRIEGKDRYVVEVFIETPRGNPVRAMTAVYTRGES